MQRARAELAQQHFQAASLECDKTEAIKVTSETRQLRKQILDAKRRDDLMIRADPIVDAQLALANDDFDRVSAIIQRAEIRGANPSTLSALRTKYWNKKDAYRLAALGADGGAWSCR